MSALLYFRMLTRYILLGLAFPPLNGFRMFGKVRTSTMACKVAQQSPWSIKPARKEGILLPMDMDCEIDTKCVVIGIAGGSASGKTTLARAIIENIGEENICFIGHDSYYKDLRHLSFEERSRVNFDHPDSLDTSLLVEHVRALREGRNVCIPTYDFSTHSRIGIEKTVVPRKIILVDGILIFSEPELLKLMDMKIFVDTADDIRLIRRISRDTRERGRSVDSVIDQYLKTVRPMHDLYVEPSKRKADIILPAAEGISPAALDMCVSRMREIVNLYQ